MLGTVFQWGTAILTIMMSGTALRLLSHDLPDCFVSPTTVLSLSARLLNVFLAETGLFFFFSAFHFSPFFNFIPCINMSLASNDRRTSPYTPSLTSQRNSNSSLSSNGSQMYPHFARTPVSGSHPEVCLSVSYLTNSFVVRISWRFSGRHPLHVPSQRR